MKRLATLSLAICGLAASTGLASADTVELYDGSGKDLFKYLDFSTSGVVKNAGETLTIKLDKDNDGSMGLFGIVGRNVANAPVEIDAASHLLRVEYKFLEDNEADLFKIVLADKDEDGAGEQYKFDVTPDADDATETSDGFMELLLPITADDAGNRTPGKDAGFSKDGDGEANYGLTQWQIQSVYGSTGALMIEIRAIEIVTMEP